MRKNSGLLLLCALCCVALFWWVPTPTKRDSTAPSYPPLVQPASSDVQNLPGPPPLRVIDQRPPAARDGTAVVTQYGFIGAIGDETGETQYLFTRAEQSFSVPLGGVLDALWRLESVETDRVRLTRLTDGSAGVIPFSNAGSGSLELPADATALTKSSQPISRRSLHSRHP